MKTTLELPEPAMRAVKARAAAPKDDAPIKLADYIGRWPYYRNMDEVIAYVPELRKDRGED